MGLWDWFIVRRKIPSHRRYAKPETRFYARSNRRHPTDAEKLMWEELKRKKLGYKFHRQAIMFGWIADFWCPRKMLMIEVDGEYHDTPKQKKADNYRDKMLNEKGITTIRVKNAEVINNIAGVVHKIKKELAEIDLNKKNVSVRYE
jgi:very-short-patch-repair endonuclease